MKKILKIIITIFIVTLLGYLVYNIVTKIQYKNKVANTLKIIPNFSFKTLENKDFTNKNLELNAHTIFIYFNSECNYCEHEAQSISDIKEQFKNTQLLFVSTENTEAIKQFATTYNLLNQPNITFLHDSTRAFSTRFDANSIPFILVYNKNQELIKKHKGQLKAEAILKLLKP